MPKISYATIDELRIRYQDNTIAGAKNLVFLHGLGGSIESWADNTSELSGKYRTVALDLPGFGLSDKPNRKYTMRFFSLFVLHAIHELGVGFPINIIGSSLGGQIAATIATISPLKVDKLILISPAGFTPRSFLGSDGLRKYTGIANATSRTEIRKALSETTPGAVMDKDVQLAGERMAIRGAKNAFISALKYSTAARRINFNRIKSPTLVIWGREDRIIPVKFILQFLTMKNCRLCVLENCGHRPHVERPTLINRIIESFIDEN
ncbi:MAG TPA: alpha/beta fold hydrolase [Nitrososphaeraceae archaeon]|nr:alpha/beta fold hydrolase [Nitrososphaeraceae archaeon]